MLRQELLREPVSAEGEYAQSRMQEIHDLLETMSQVADQFKDLTQEDVHPFEQDGAEIQ